MKLRFMSDLHCEFMDDRGRAYIKSLDPADSDVLVLAGDLTNPSLVHNTLQQFLEQFPKADIVFVLGNHDYYCAEYEQALLEARSLSFMCDRLHVLEREVAIVRGRRFFGATLWYPIDRAKDPITYARWKSWSDYRWIEDSQDFIPGLYEKTLEAMEEQLEPGDIVVTHMLPTPKSIGPEWQGMPTNSFFLGDCTGIIAAKRPELWIHGHTHGHFDYHMGVTRVVANPKGLPWMNENPKYDPNWTIEISDKKEKT